MVEPHKGPRLLLENCLVRGDGDLLLARATRPAALEMTNTLAALAGSVYAAEFPGGATAPPAAHKFTLAMKNVTAYLSGPLVRLKPEKGARATVPVECDATASLFTNNFRSPRALQYGLFGRIGDDRFNHHQARQFLAGKSYITATEAQRTLVTHRSWA